MPQHAGSDAVGRPFSRSAVGGECVAAVQVVPGAELRSSTISIAKDKELPEGATARLSESGAPATVVGRLVYSADERSLRGLSPGAATQALTSSGNWRVDDQALAEVQDFLATAVAGQ